MTKTSIKTEQEIQTMYEGGKILAEILKKLSEAVKPGITTNDLDELARELVLSCGVKASCLGYNGYPAALCTSVNDEIVHAIPSDRVLKEGDLLKLDMGVLHKGFHTDSAITVLVGQNDEVIHKTTSQVVYPQVQKLINVTREALNIGISKAKIGNTLGDIGSAIQKYVEQNGFNVVRDLVGHGIGRKLHEPPQVLNYLSRPEHRGGEPEEGEKLVEGMVIAIEPMVVAGDWRIKNGKDGFAFVTKDGGLAAHFEHTVAITDAGPLILTK
jgi:methionyl aminopeptidase